MKLKLCSYPGCQKVSASYYCDVHKAQSEARKQARKPYQGAQRFADYSHPQWRKLRREILKDASCSYCGSRDNLQVHHIKPVRYAPELFLDRSNCMVLCRNCHAVVTRREIEQRRHR